MAKLTTNQKNLIEDYAFARATFKKYWVIYCLPETDFMDRDTARNLTVDWAIRVFEAAEKLGFSDADIQTDSDVMFWKNQQKVAA